MKIKASGAQPGLQGRAAGQRVQCYVPSLLHSYQIQYTNTCSPP